METYLGSIHIIIECSCCCFTIYICTVLIIPVSSGCGIPVCDDGAKDGLELKFRYQWRALNRQRSLTEFHFVCKCFASLTTPTLRWGVICSATAFMVLFLKPPVSPPSALWSTRNWTNSCVSFSFQRAVSLSVLIDIIAASWVQIAVTESPATKTFFMMMVVDRINLFHYRWDWRWMLDINEFRLHPKLRTFLQTTAIEIWLKCCPEHTSELALMLWIFPFAWLKFYNFIELL